MSFQGYFPGPVPPEPLNGAGPRPCRVSAHVSPPRYWLHLLLLIATAATSTVMGAVFAQNFRSNQPAFDLERDLEVLQSIWGNPWLALEGLPFSLTLLGILLAHELGHYLACVRYRVDASLPYFLPAPTPIGTLGAFIRIRSPIYSKRVLFDIGIAGPIAGFIVLLPVLAIGLALSKVHPGIAARGDMVLGTPPVLWMLEQFIFPGVPASDIYLHPVARAAWVGVFATALNLLPIGQLDGGHILYSLVGDKHKVVSRVLIAALIPCGLFGWHGWLIWAAVLFFFGTRHPAIYDPTRLDSERRRLGWLALAVFLLSFTFAPIQAGNSL